MGLQVPVLLMNECAFKSSSNKNSENVLRSLWEIGEGRKEEEVVHGEGRW